VGRRTQPWSLRCAWARDRTWRRGSCITDDVPADALALGRSRQVVKQAGPEVGVFGRPIWYAENPSLRLKTQHDAVRI